MPSGVYDHSKRPSSVSPETKAAIVADSKLPTMTHMKLATKYKLHFSTISRLLRDEGAPTRKNSSSGELAGLSEELRRKIYAEYWNNNEAGGPTRQELATKYKLSTYTIDRIKNQEPKAGPATPQRRSSSQYGHLETQMKALQAQGCSYSEIAAKLGMPSGKKGVSAVGYYLNTRDKRLVKPTEGVSTNGHKQLDTRFLVGFGCAELERTLTAIAQRLGIAPNVLRQGFSVFLGSSSLR